MTKRILIIVLGLFAAATAVSAAAPSFRYQRRIKVEKSGWVRTRVPLEALFKLSSTGKDWTLYDPEGRATPAFTWKPAAMSPPTIHEVPLTNIRSVPGGWYLEADLGPKTKRHRRIFLDIPGTGLAEKVTLEGSMDARSWHILARGAMFRLNLQGETEKTSLDYPPTKDRYLRIFWPASAGFPHWRAVRVQDWDEKRAATMVEEPLPIRLRSRTDTTADYEVRMPAAPIRAFFLVLLTTVPYPLRFRLLSPKNGAWVTLKESIVRVGELPGIVVSSIPLHGTFMVSVDAGGYKVPPLKRGAVLLYEPVYFTFNARTVGVYTFRYGALGRAVPTGLGGGALPPASRSSAVVKMGPELVLSPPSLPALPTLTGGVLPAVNFKAAWSITAPGAVRNKLVSLEAPQALYAVARPDLRDLRIAHDGHQVPYVLWQPPDGEVALRLTGMHPKASDKEGISMLSFELPYKEIPITMVALSAPSAPFTRRIAMEYLKKVPLSGEKRGAKKYWSPMANSLWYCPGASELPAGLNLYVRRQDSRRFRLLFKDGDNAALPTVNVVVWRERHILRFPWPGKGPVTLLAGSMKLNRPHYDLGALKDELLRYPAVTAVAAPVTFSRGGGSAPIGVRRWILGVFLFLACVVLLAILVHALRQGSSAVGEE